MIIVGSGKPPKSKMKVENIMIEHMKTEIYSDETGTWKDLGDFPFGGKGSKFKIWIIQFVIKYTL